MTATPITNDTQWHALRAKTVGGSEISALFGLSPFTTAFSLWHEKAGKAEPADFDNQKINWGKLIEPLIAQELARALGWKLERSPMYYQHDTIPGMGCTLDFDVIDNQWGPGIVETKVVFDYGDYKRDWSDDRAPPNYELQAQHQMMVTGREWCAIAVWVAQTATLAPALIRRPAPKVVRQIEERIRDFWQSIAEDRAPDPAGTEAELTIMRHLWPARAEKKIVEIGSARLQDAAQQYLWASEQLPGIEREKTARKAQLLAAAKDAALLRVPGFDIGIRQNKKGAVYLDVRQAENGVQIDTPASTTLAA